MSNQKTSDMVRALHIIAHGKDPVLKREVEDAQWSDFGRRAHQNITSENLVKAINRALLKSKSHFEATAMIRAYLLTGTLP